MSPVASWLVAFIFVGGSGLYVWAFLGWPDYFLPYAEPNTAAEFKARYPQWRWLIVAHTYGGWAVIVLVMLAGFGLVGSQPRLPPPLSYAIGYGVWLALLQALQGLLETLTAISPIYGFLIRRLSAQRFIYDPRVRRLGRWRLAFSLIVLSGLVGLMVVA